MNNNEVLVNSIDWPLNPKFPFPLDVRQFFSSKEEADAAAANAVVAEVNRDTYGNVTGTTIPSEEDGGRETVYYFGEPIVVVNADRTEGTLYLIVKQQNSSQGILVDVGTSALENYYTKSETEEKINEICTQEIGQLDVDTLNGLVYSSIDDGCGNTQYLNAIYVKGIKEVDGKIAFDENASLVVAFDNESQYSPENPLATTGTVRRFVGNLRDEISETINNIQNQITNIDIEINKIKAGETSVFELRTLDGEWNEVGDYWAIDSSIEGLMFEIISKYDDIDKIKITSDNGYTRTYSPSHTNTYAWPYIIHTTTHFVIEIQYGETIKTLTKDIEFVNPSKYGIMSKSHYDLIVNTLNPYDNRVAFQHAYDINGLDYISCYSVFELVNFSDMDLIVPISPEREKTVVRGYYDNFETEAIDGLNVDEMFYVIAFLPRIGYLCYIKTDVCQINNFKQRFEL